MFLANIGKWPIGIEYIFRGSTLENEQPDRCRCYRLANLESRIMYSQSRRKFPHLRFYNRKAE